jgi:hypothetical protein
METLRTAARQKRFRYCARRFTGLWDNVQLYVTRTELHELLAQAYAAQQQSDSAAVHCRHVAAALANADPQARPRFQRAVQAVSARRN